LRPAQFGTFPGFAALSPGGLRPIYLNDDEIRMHPVEVFDVERPWENLKTRLARSP
jgi:hypothetical protein